MKYEVCVPMNAMHLVHWAYETQEYNKMLSRWNLIEVQIQSYAMYLVHSTLQNRKSINRTYLVVYGGSGICTWIVFAVMLEGNSARTLRITSA